MSFMVTGVAAQEQSVPRQQDATLPPITVVTSQAPKRKPKRAAARPMVRATATSSQPARANAPAAPAIERGTGFGTRTTDSAGKGYAMPNATTATRMNGRVFETPYSIQTVPSDVIRDQAVTTVSDALKNVSGVQIDQQGPFSGINVRGFSQNGTDRWIYRDGAPYRNSTFDFANIDRIEVLKGTAGGIYGRIDPGGLVNVVTKKPLATPHYSIEQWVSSNNLGLRTVGDATGSLTEDGSVRYRAIGAFENRDTFRDLVDSQNILLSPSISWDITPTTELYVNYEYRRLQRVYDDGIPVINDMIPDVPRNRFYGLKDQPPSVFETHLVDAILTQQLADGWVAKVRGTYSTDTRSSYGASPDGFSPPPGFTDIGYSYGHSSLQNHFVEASITGDTQITQDIRNRLFASMESYHSEHDFVTTPWVYLNPLSLQNPVYQSWRDVANLPLTDGSLSFTEWRAVTFQDQVTLFDRLDLIGGGRWDWSNAGDSPCTLTGGATNCPPSMPMDVRAFNVFKPRGGVNFRVTPEVALFASYSESFGPPVFGSTRRTDGSLPDPTEATQYEAGAKFQTPDRRLNTTVAVYDLTRTNTNVPVQGRPNVVEQIGEARSRGVEVDVSGHLTDRLQVTANYSYTDARITRDRTSTGGPGNTGHRLYNVPLHQGGIWLQYSLPSGWRFGGGAFAANNRWGNNANTFRIGDYVRVDANASYSWDTGFGKATASLNVQNLFDERYFTNATPFWTVMPAQGRTFIGRLRFER